MDVTVVSSNGDKVQVAVLGNVTLGSSPQQLDPLSEIAGDQIYGQNVLLDLSRAPMIDSSGIGWLLRCQEHCTKGGGRLVIHSVAPAVISVLKIMKLDQVLTLATDAPTAQAIVEGENL